MAKITDILFDDNCEEIAKDGDLVIGDGTMQCIKLLINCEKAENKKHVDSGVGVGSWLLDEAGKDDLKKEITAQVEGDGARVEKFEGDSLETLTVTVKYA